MFRLSAEFANLKYMKSESLKLITLPLKSFLLKLTEIHVLGFQQVTSMNT